MKRTWILAGVLVLSVAAYLIWIFPKYRNSLDPRDIAFALPDTAAITRIVMDDQMNGKSLRRVELTKTATGNWVLNGQYPAFEPGIHRLMVTIAAIQVKEPLAEKGEKAGLQIIKLRRTLVELYGGKKLLKTYYLSTEAKDGRGSLMMMLKARHPYIVALPGHQGFINGFYSTDTTFWRENLLFSLNLDNLQSIQVQFPANAAASFELTRTDTLAPWKLQPGDNLPDMQTLASYLSLFKGKMYAEAFVNQRFPGVKDSLEQQVTPTVNFSLKPFNGKARTLVLYSRGTDDPNNYFGWIKGEEELVTVQRYVIDKFLPERSRLLSSPPNQGVSSK